MTGVSARALTRRGALRSAMVAAVAAVAWLAAPPANAAAPDAPGLFLGEHAVGRADAPITVVEYASLSCPACAQFHNAVWPRIKAEFVDTGQVRFVFRDYPHNGPGLRAAMLARCAGEARYPAMKDVLFKSQSGWVHAEYLKGLFAVARLAGFDADRFERCMTDKPLEEAVIQSRMEGQRSGRVTGLPTFVINDGAAVVTGAREEDFVAALVRLGARRTDGQGQ